MYRMIAYDSADSDSKMTVLKSISGVLRARRNRASEADPS